MNPEDNRNIYNQEIKSIHKVLTIAFGICVIVSLVTGMVLDIVSSQYHELANVLNWLCVSAMLLYQAFYFRKIDKKTTILLLVISAGTIIYAFTHFIYLMALIIPGILFTAVYHYRHVLKPLINEEENSPS